MKRVSSFPKNPSLGRNIAIHYGVITLINDVVTNHFFFFNFQATKLYIKLAKLGAWAIWRFWLFCISILFPFSLPRPLWSQPLYLQPI